MNSDINNFITRILTEAPWAFLSLVLAACAGAVVLSYLSSRSARKYFAAQRRVIDLVHLRDQFVKLEIMSELRERDLDELLPAIERAFERADDECETYLRLAFDERDVARMSRAFSKIVT